MLSALPPTPMSSPSQSPILVLPPLPLLQHWSAPQVWPGTSSPSTLPLW